MKFSLPVDEVPVWLAHLLRGAFHDADLARLDAVCAAALERTEHCFSRIALRGYRRDDEPYFDHLHGDQSASFLYFCANSAWRLGEQRLAAQLFLLNKARNGLVCMYDTELPAVFLLNHTVGTMLGKAAYSEYFVAYHGVTVGTDRGGTPTIGARVVMYPQSSVTGACTVGSDVVFAAKSATMRTDVPADSIVSGVYPAVAILPRRRGFAERYFRL